ncbi:putative 26S proteasome regulatory subunit [Verticillium nonalfalfae]|uniref:Probable 26S proteasome regulatory subunit p27 n=1 Tax=Verticillium nonalfalfae TaxID=1051616 RepID=A0A3M9Y3J3_9PEZI|nr:putative 26S proteasome regulatory subunit [Verticillium nonalfalfae]RNJ54841.1 putative 26S proteasome regulatory subunit [Verticillium nonalfalfae]
MGLPLRMDNLHAPTVPSGPASFLTSKEDYTKLTYLELQAQKIQMETEMQALSAILDSHGSNMTTPLTTRDGFPRADIDVAQVRTTRARIIHLRNDYKDLMAVVTRHLDEYFARPGSEDDAAQDVPTTAPRATAHTTDRPFARVNSVTGGSPAEQAGLKIGDEIVNFGHVNRSNHDSLKKVGECVQANEQRNVAVQIIRSRQGDMQEVRTLNLVPNRDWGGRGLLGCHILPL